MIEESGYWLPEDYILQLTAMELGGLAACLVFARSHSIGRALMYKRGPNGEKVATTLVDRLLEKVEAARVKTEEDASKLASAMNQSRP